MHVHLMHMHTVVLTIISSHGGGGQCSFSMLYRLFTLQRVNQDELVYWTKPSSPSLTEQDECDLKDYFRLEHSLVFLYQFWAKRDENFSTKSLDYGGVRLLSQRPLEALLSFITSSNNNIHRIQSLMRKMCHAFGDNLGSHGDQDYHSFPSLSQLCGDGVEQKLRELGFGYRAKYIHQTTVKLSTELGGEAWLNSLRQRSYHGTLLIGLMLCSRQCILL